MCQAGASPSTFAEETSSVVAKPKRVIPKKFLKQLASFSVALDGLSLNARRASVKWLWEACCSDKDAPKGV